MHTSSNRGRRRAVVSASLGLLLVGSAAVPAYAESIRSTQWHLDAMQADEMWKVSTGKGVTVAVIDGGVDADHPDLQGQVLEGLDLAPAESGDESTDYNGHGTGMAGIVAGTGRMNGGNGAFGLAPGAKILPIRMPEGGHAKNAGEGADKFQKPVSTAIRYAADSGAKVINISLGVVDGSDQLTDAVKYALGKGALIFAAAGNDGDGDPEFPAATPGVVGVGAVDRSGKKTEESQYGKHVDLVAPGQEIVGPCTSETKLCKGHGTSDATAIASASAALIWAAHPEWTNNQVLRVMLDTAAHPKTGERTDYVGYGAVRPRIALKTPGDPGPADTYPLPDLAAAASPTPSLPAAGKDAETKQPAEAANGTEDDSNGTLWIALGAGVAVIIGAAVAMSVIRSRRSNSYSG